jgi:apolipoprotein N-acyltransferase
LPFVLAIFFGFACWLAKSLSPIRTAAGYLSFTAFIGLCEFLRGHIFTGFPWNLFGYGWADILEVPQIIYQTDIYFLSWLTLFWLAVPGFLWIHRQSLKSCAALAIVALISFAAVYGYGALRLQNNPTAYHDNVQVKLIQANIDQAEKWDGALMAQHVLKHLKLSAQNPSSEDMTTFIVWPETAISYHFFEEALYPGMIRDMLSSYGGKAYLVTGLLDFNKTDQTYANALALIDRSGVTVDRYAKSHLVPFGEYIPFQDYIPLAPITQFSGFQPGDGAKLMTSEDGLSFAPSICYEGIFPGTLENLAPPPDFIVNVTNDAWYGFSAGPYQHFAQTRFRAIEEGVPVIRSANTGISGVVDPMGRIVFKTDIFVDSSENIYLPNSYKNNRIMKSFTIAFILMMVICISFGYRLKMRNISQ